MRSKRVPNLADITFLMLEGAAIAGIRCPMTRPHGPVDAQGVKTLLGQGRVRVEVFPGNWRVATILQGPNAGKSTLRSPKRGQAFRTLGAPAPKIRASSSDPDADAWERLIAKMGEG